MKERLRFRKKANYIAAVLMFGILISSSINIFMLFQSSFIGNIADVNNNQSDNIQRENSPSPKVSDGVDLWNIPWVGHAKDRPIRTYIYGNNSVSGQKDYFNITVPQSPSAVYGGQYNFSFTNNYITNYTFENNTALNYPRYYVDSRNNSHFSTNPSTSSDSYTVEAGSVSSGGFDYMVDASLGTAVTIVSSAANEVNVTYNANFTGIDGFNRSKVCGMRYFFHKELSNDVSIQIYAYNYMTSSWDLMKDGITWNVTKQGEVVSVINYNLKYFNDNNITRLKLRANSTGSFTLSLYDLRVEALSAYEQPITKNNRVALEFDLQGNSTVYGFYAWVRSLNKYGPTNANLTIALYRANQTAKREDVLSPLETVMRPDSSKLIAIRNITNYNGDSYSYFSFNTDNSGYSLNVSNYFVVIYSNIIEENYSIIIMPYGDDGSDSNEFNTDPDEKIDHLFMISSDSGTTWSKKYLISQSYQFDAAPFAINISRGWMPSDINITMDGKSLSSYSLSTGIYENTSGYKWGLATWDNYFDNQTVSQNGNISIFLDWDKNITGDLYFNVSYNATIYSIESAYTIFNSTSDSMANWIVNYTLDDSKYPGWNLIKFSYFLPKDWLVSNLHDPNGTLITANLTGPETIDIYKVYTLSYSDTIKSSGNGNYSLNCSSPDYIYNITTFLHYDEYKWQTQGFMQGDNICAEIDIQNYTDTSEPVTPGDAYLELYNITKDLTTSFSIINSSPQKTHVYNVGENRLMSIFDFNNSNIMNTTADTLKGTYYIAARWTNGDELGYRTIPIYITDYTPTLTNVAPDFNTRKNLIYGIIHKNDTDLGGYDVSLFAINETTGQGTSQTPFLNYSANRDYSSNYINLTDVVLNETLFNPGEKVKVNVTIESYNPYWNNSVKVGVKFVQSANTNWVAFGENSSEFNLQTIGHENSSHTFQFELEVPSDFKGLNAPIRLNPLQLVISLWVNSVPENDYTLPKLFPLVNYTDDQLEGNVINYQTKDGRRGPSLLMSMNRTNSILPGTTLYLLQLKDFYFVSSNFSAIYRFTSKLMTNFDNIQTQQTIWGKHIQVSGRLIDERGNPLINKNVSFNYYFNNSWEQYKVNNEVYRATTDSDGYFNAEIDSTICPKSLQFRLKMIFNEDSSYYANETEESITLINYNNALDIKIMNYTDQPHLTKSELNTIVVKLYNSGNSTLLNITLTLIAPNASYSIGKTNTTAFIELSPGESEFVEYYITPSLQNQGNSYNMTFLYSCITLESNEYVGGMKKFEMVILEPNVFKNWDESLLIFIFLGVIAVFVFAIYYAINTNRKIQEVPTKVKAEKTKKYGGKYVNISELSSRSIKERYGEEGEEEEE
ncbi:MAG: hypothetical protein ACTSVC_13015, partial [Promethearchaeota archaeon]